MIFEDLFSLSPDIRYVALYRDGRLESHQRPGLNGASSAESDRYEELIVNPVLLKLVQQRGDIDCGGALWIAIRYGNFLQVVRPVAGGHVSVAFEPTCDPIRLMPVLERILAEHGLSAAGQAVRARPPGPGA